VEEIRGDVCEACGFSEYWEKDCWPREGPNFEPSGTCDVDPPPEPDLDWREEYLSGVCDRLKKEWSREDAGRAGAVGGDMAPAAPGAGCAGCAVAKGEDDMDGRENMEVDGGSRVGRSVSEPSIDDIDMLLPGRCDGPGAGSRGGNDGGGGCDAGLRGR
jgi:hypothetical protein